RSRSTSALAYLYGFVVIRDSYSFPTRRSSDLHDPSDRGVSLHPSLDSTPRHISAVLEFQISQLRHDLIHRNLEVSLILLHLAEDLCHTPLVLQHHSLTLNLTLHDLELLPTRIQLLPTLLELHRLLLELYLLVRRRRCSLVSGVGKEHRRVLQVRVLHNLGGGVVDVPRRHRKVHPAGLNHLSLLLPDRIEMDQLLLPRADSQTDVHRHVSTRAPLLRIHRHPHPAQLHQFGLLLVLQQQLVDVQKQRLDASLSEDTSNSLDLHLREIGRLRENGRLNVLQVLRRKPLRIARDARP